MSKRKSFRYHQLEIYKSLELGKGSYGAVYKAKCDQLMCAAKILHDELIHKQNTGVDKAIERFELECEFLSGFRHPNIVQYLGTARCPERSKLPILMMELLEENLTTMLENAKHPLPYYLEVNICHDIALAIAYLHSNEIIHRDLSSNNVLITAGRKAKVTDFGMSRLIKKGDSPPIMTPCPGTLIYMPPEALKEPPSYTERLDCFSAGVLMIQVCSRQLPALGERTNHIKMVRKMHPLLPIANKCLSDNQYERPLAEDICQRLAILQDGVEYKLSLLPTNADPKDVTELERQNKLLQKRLDQQDQQMKENENTIRDIRQENESLQAKVNRMMQVPGSGSRSTGPTKSKQKWIPGRNLPTEMIRGAVAVDGDVAYFMNTDGTLFRFDSTADPYEAWCQLVKCPLEDSCLAIVDGLLTAVGGWEFRGMGNRMTGKLLSLRGQEIRTWESHFPDMPTKRRLAAAITTTKHLIVIGGISKVGIIKSLDAIDKVEVLNTAASPLTWTEVARLSQPYCKISATTCGNQLYVLGGDHRGATKLVLACSLNNLLLSNRDTEPNAIWRQPTSAPHYFSTCVSINDELLAVGGASDITKNPQAKTEVYRYNQSEGSWNLFTNMITPRYNSLVAVFPTKNLMVVVGGMDRSASRDITELCYM